MNVTAEPGIIAASAFDVEKLRADFPILNRYVHATSKSQGKQLVYFDNGATTQKPQQVIDVIDRYYSHYNANIHRGVHALSQEASAAYEAARKTVARFVNAASEQEVIFTRGTTESVNLVAHSFLRRILNAGDEVLITGMEHHSNIVPWQLVCEERGAILKVVPVTDSGELDTAALDTLLTPHTRIFAFTHVSNTLGTVNDVKALTALAHSRNVAVLIDGAQAAPHLAIDVQEIGCDFYCFSGHKTYAPTGIGMLYVRSDMMQSMQPYQGGGGIISTVTFEKTTFVEGPLRFEAGTPNIEGAIGFAAALDYMNAAGIANIAAHEHQLLMYATAQLEQIEGMRIIGNVPCKAGVISFVVGNLHPYDIGTILDQQGIAVRTGHHCTQPLMQRFGVPGTVRASFALYNTHQEVDLFIAALHKALRMLA
ncbi:MAG: aminotransferase class V-fold PLP-dependent enzyme [Bacteroidia bacterium]